ncbi:amino acid adenylation domain-containing protein [Chitinophaga sp. Hz27]|uniref:amino acid adenylation domain-containing protein n=1 Tax=Chitinophaga sp. Hz27 TaxID=3347169 RepID=UPI0035DF4096
MNDKNNIQKIYPLTAMQEGMLFHAMYGGTNAYFNQVCYRTSGMLNVSLLEESLDMLSLRHDILRTAFVYEKNERPIQVVLKNRRIGFLLTDISHLSEGEAAAFIAEFRQQDIARGFDLVKDPLMRLTVIKLADNGYEFVWSHHHILLDGWCIPVLLQELVTIYHTLVAGQPVKLAAPVPFSLYIQWLEKQDKQVAANYWRDYLHGYTSVAAVPPVLFPASENSPRETLTEKLRLGDTVTAQLEAIVRREKVTMNILFQAVWGLLVAKFNNTNDVVYGNVVSGRPSDIPGVNEILGLFINTIPLRIRFQPDTRFSDLLRTVHNESLEGLPYHYAPLAEIQSGSALKRDLLQHIVAVENYPLEESIKQSGSNGDIFDVQEVKMFEETNYDFHINVMVGGQFEVIMSYNPTRYTTAYIRAMLHEFEQIITQVIQDEDVQVGDLFIEVPLEVRSQPAFQLAYWKKQLSGTEPLQIPTDFARTAAPQTDWNTESLRIDQPEYNALAILSFDENTTLYNTLLAAWNVLMFRYTGQNSISTGIPVTRENNLLPLHIQMDTVPIFSQLLQEVKRNSRAAAEHQDVSLFAIADATGISAAEIFAVTFAPADTAVTTDTELQVNISEKDEGVIISICYAANLYTAATIQRMLAHYHQIIRGIIADPAAKNALLPLLSEKEAATLLKASAERTAGYPYHKTINDLIEAQVVKTPENIAVTFGTQQLSYRVLNERANRLAHYLRLRGVEPDSLVPVCLERGPEMIVALLGILKAGGAYVPVDPAYPKERIAFMLEDTAAPIVLAAANTAHVLASNSHAELILLDDHWDKISQEDAGNPAPVAAPHHLAYVIYTSGSTGKPKGVLIEHRNVVRLFETDAPLYDFNSNDVWTMFHSFCFDFSVWEMYGALFYGGRVVIVPKDTARDAVAFAALLLAEGVTVLNQTPSAFYVLQESLSSTPADLNVRYVIFGGEALNPAAVKPWAEMFPACRIINMYGITETTVHVTYQEIGEAEMNSSRSVIGEPIPTLGLYILDGNLNLSPIGVPGELYVSGAGLARGYLHRDQLTSERFIPNPFNGGKQGRLYKTGDQARWLPDGNIEYLGRIDNQVKIRGFRIELGEIENAIQQSGLVKQAVVIADTDRSGEKRLVAYITTEDNFSRVALLSYLDGRLPEYMVPAIIIPLPFFPLTSNGKTDRNALPAPDAGPVATYEPPANETEEVLVKIWQQLLGVERLGVYDNFFELGGHSLSAIRMVAAINKHFSASLKVVAVFQHATIRELARHINQDEATFTAIPTAPVLDTYPLSHAQKRLWLIYQMDDAQSNYNLPLAFTFRGNVDVAALAAAFNLLVTRHEILRTILITENGEPRQQILRHGDRLALQVSDLRGRDDVHAQVAALVAGASATVFNLSDGPLYNAYLWQTDEQEYVFFFVLHHIITDAWSTAVIMNDLLQFYQGLLDHNKAMPPALTIQYKDYAVWDLAQSQQPGYEAHRNYWIEQFREPAPVLELPTDYPRPALPEQNGKLVLARVDAALLTALKSIANQQGVSLFMLLLAGFKALLYRYTGQDDLVIGSPAAGRSHTDLDNQVGFYVNTLALRTRFSGAQPFADLLQAVKTSTLGAYEHQQFPFDQLVEELAIPRETGHSPLFDVMFVLQNMESDGLLRKDALSFEVDDFPLGSQGNKFDLTVEMWESGSALEIMLEYNSGIFSEARITRMAQHFCNLLAAVAKNLQTPVVQLTYIDEEEKELLLQVFAGKADKLPKQLNVVRLFEEIVQQYPDSLAVADEITAYTYRELNARANRLAHYLRHHYYAGENNIIGIVMSRTADFITAMLATLKTGAAYLPLEHSTPKDRIRTLLGQTDAILVLTDDTTLVDELDAGIPVIAPTEATLALFPQDNLHETSISGDSLAYVMFTSGSTGTPKGVMVTHKSIIRLIRNTNYIQLTEKDRILQTGSLSFDAATFEIWGALLNGGQVHLLDLMHLLDTRQLAAAIREKEITTMWFTASWFNQLADQDPSLFSPLSRLLAGGEALSPSHIRKVQEACPDTIIINGYGPTENTTFSICGPVPKFPEAAVPLGRPITHSTVYIVDSQLQPVPVGIPGEILLGGEGLSTGYIGDPQRTAQQFIIHPFEEGELVYRSGDIGRWLENGTVAFLGRVDDQVKIRGYRVEPGEIAHAIKDIPAVRDAYVSAEKNAQGNKMLICFYTADQALQPAMLKSALKAQLPDYMVPSLFIHIAQLPLNRNGKIDRQALPDIDLLLDQQAAGNEAPATTTETAVLGLWEEVLGRTGFGMQDNFFEVGGSSLMAYRIISLIETRMGVSISLVVFFRNPEIRSLAAIIATTEKSAVNMIPQVPVASLYESSRAQQRLWILDKLETEKHAFNITAAFVISGDLDLIALQQAFQLTVVRHEILRTVFVEQDGLPWQRIIDVDNCKVSVPVTSVSGAVREHGINLLKEEELHVFQLDQWPLIRMQVVSSTAEHVLVVNMHHIISDGWSVQLFYTEILTQYTQLINEAKTALPDLRIQYKDYAAWHQRRLQQSSATDELYWLNKLQQELRPELPLDFQRPRTRAYSSNSLHFALDNAALNTFRNWTKEQEVSMFMICETLVALWLRQYTKSNDVAIGTTSAGRDHPDLQQQMGFYVNVIVLRTQLQEQDSFFSALEKVKATTLEAYEHQHYPFDLLVDKLKQKRDLGRNPLFDVMLAFTDGFNVEAPAATNFAELTAAPGEGSNKYDLSFYFNTDNQDGIQIELIYNNTLFRESTAQQLQQLFISLVAQVLANPNVPLKTATAAPLQEAITLDDDFS